MEKEAQRCLCRDWKRYSALHVMRDESRDVVASVGDGWLYSDQAGHRHLASNFHYWRSCRWSRTWSPEIVKAYYSRVLIERRFDVAERSCIG